MGNQRQVGMIWMNYCSEYNGHLPGASGDAYTPGYLDYWPQYMHTYFYPAIKMIGSVNIMKNSILECPSAPFPTPSVSRTWPAYGMLWTGIGGHPVSAGGKIYQNIAQVKYPSRQIAFSDTYLSWAPADMMVGWFYLWPREGHFRHSKNMKQNVLFCDGHVELNGRNDPIYRSLDDNVWGSP